MSYFNSFNYVLYPNFQDPDQKLILKNITSRVVRKISPLDDKSLFYTYTILEGEKPEDISYKLYGKVWYYWTILLINERFDYQYDFPLSSKLLNDYIVEKYGSATVAYNTPKYYIRTDEQLVNSDAADNPDKDFTDNFINVPNSFVVGGVDYTFSTYPEYSDGVLMKKSIDSYEWEIQENEKKRNILVLQKQYIENFADEFNKLINR
jgi:hypothetical protein